MSPSHRSVLLSCRFGLKKGIDFAHFVLDSAIVFQGKLRDYMNTLVVSISHHLEKEREISEFEIDFKKYFCWRSNYPVCRGFSPAWLLAFAKSFESFVGRINIWFVLYVSGETALAQRYMEEVQAGERSGERVFFLPLLLPLPYFDASTAHLESFFDSLGSLSLNVQIDRTAKYACFAGHQKPSLPRRRSSGVRHTCRTPKKRLRGRLLKATQGRNLC